MTPAHYIVLLLIMMGCFWFGIMTYAGNRHQNEFFAFVLPALSFIVWIACLVTNMVRVLEPYFR